MRSCPRCHLEFHGDETRCVVDGAELVEVDDPRIGALIGGRYHLDAVLGEGGMATVFRAHHSVIKRELAVKLLHPHIAKDARIRERFAREARAAAAIAHPNVIEIYDFGDTEDGTPYLVMELLEGEPLRSLVERGPMPLPLAVEIATQLMRGLARAHDLGVAHRDLKPENAFVRIGPDGSVVAKLVDFGIAHARGDARLTDIGAIIGTPQYVAPERFRGTESGAPADLYSFGVMLFEMVTGQLPFHADGLPGWILMHLEATPPSPSSLRADLPPPLESLVLALLAKEPAGRPVDARAVLDVLEPLRASLGPLGPLVANAPVRQAAPSASPSPTRDDARPADLANDASEWTRETPLPPAPDAVATPSSTAVPATGGGTPTQSLTIERWQKRAAIVARMLERAYPQGTAPAALLEDVREVERALTRMAALRDARLAETRKLEAIDEDARDARERLGHAVHEVGELLSRARTELRAAEEALERRRIEAQDLEFQMGALRDKLAEAEAASSERREGAGVQLTESGAELEQLRREVGRRTLHVLDAVRREPSVRPLLAELERAHVD